jgi:hypothetical protein
MRSNPARCFQRSTADSVDYRKDLVTFAKRIQRRKSEASLGPKRRHDQLFATRRLDCCDEFHVFPGVDRGAVKWFNATEYLLQLMDGRLIHSSLHIHLESTIGSP